MKTQQLICLVALDRHRHFGRAAAACYMTQPALSVQIRKLEQELGVQLFDRSRTPVEPTEAGAAAAEQARRVLQELERLREVAGERKEGVSGELRLGVIPTLAPDLLPAALPALVERHPALRVQVEELQTESVVERVRRRELDVGLVATEVKERGLKEIRLFREAFVGYLSAEHRLAAKARLRVSDLRLDDLWLLTHGHCLREQVVGLCGNRAAGGSDPHPRLRFESGNLETLKRLVEHSGGMTLLPQLAVRFMGSEERRRVRPFAPPVPSREVRLVHAARFAKGSAVEALAQELVRVGP